MFKPIKRYMAVATAMIALTMVSVSAMAAPSIINPTQNKTISATEILTWQQHGTSSYYRVQFTGASTFNRWFTKAQMTCNGSTCRFKPHAGLVKAGTTVMRVESYPARYRYPARTFKVGTGARAVTPPPAVIFPRRHTGFMPTTQKITFRNPGFAVSHAHIVITATGYRRAKNVPVRCSGSVCSASAASLPSVGNVTGSGTVNVHILRRGGKWSKAATISPVNFIAHNAAIVPAGTLPTTVGRQASKRSLPGSCKVYNKNVIMYSNMKLNRCVWFVNNARLIIRSATFDGKGHTVFYDRQKNFVDMVGGGYNGTSLVRRYGYTHKADNAIVIHTHVNSKAGTANSKTTNPMRSNEVGYASWNKCARRFNPKANNPTRWNFAKCYARDLLIQPTVWKARATVSGNNIINVSQAIYVLPYASRNLISGNYIQAAHVGIYLDNMSRYTAVRHNYIVRTMHRNYARAIQRAYPGIVQVSKHTDREGLAIDASRSNTIANNIFVAQGGNNTHGISLYANAGESGNIRAGYSNWNNIYSNQFHGFYNGVYLGKHYDGHRYIVMSKYYFGVKFTRHSTVLSYDPGERAEFNAVRYNSFFRLKYGVQNKDYGNKVYRNKYVSSRGANYLYHPKVVSYDRY